MSSALRSALVFSFIFGVAALSAPGCSQQGEGERCDKFKAGDADCDSGLECVAKAELLDNVSDRCCPAEGNESDERCRRGSVNTAGTGGGGTGGTSNSEAGAAGAAESLGGSSAGATTAPDAGGAAGASTEEPVSGGMSSGGASTAEGGVPTVAGAGGA